MKKEQYLVKCPSRIQFGDPMYYEEYKGKRLSDLVADIKPPKGFAARVVLSEEPLKELPIYMDRQMKIYLAPEQEMKTYMDGYKYENQVHKEKLIGVDSACYQLMIDGKKQEIYTGGDGYWGNTIEITHRQNNKQVPDAFIVTASIPECKDFQEMREMVTSLFSDTQLLPEQAESEEAQMKMN